jgi:hypothetical protein
MRAAAREALWAKLRDAALVEGEAPAAEAHSPWFVRLMLGIAGWIGAIFLLAFVGIGFAALMRSASAGIAVGAAVCALAVFLFRLGDKGDLLGQFAFATSLAGQALMVIGYSNAIERSDAGAALLAAAQQAILFALVPNFVHRVWTAASGACAVAFALGDFGLGAYAPALLTAAFAALWLSEFDHPRQGQLLRAGGYGIAAAAVVSVTECSLPIFWDCGANGRMHAWGGGIAGGAVLVWAAIALLRREQVSLASAVGRTALIGAAVLAAASLTAPGIAPSTAILALGYANANRLLAGLGLIALIGYLSHYYYSLHATLLEKSALLAAAGIALLLARFALHRVWPAKETSDA